MSESEICEASTADLLDIGAKHEEPLWLIAVWPGIPGTPDVLASDAGVVATTDAAVLWQSIVAVHANTHSLIVETSRSVFRLAPGHRTFVIREA
jgi:hypothetical protein